MCVLSVVIDDQSRRWRDQYPWVDTTSSGNVTITTGVSKEEFEKLKREVEALRKLVEAAREFDADTGQPDCESDDKIALLKKIADALGVDISFVEDKKIPSRRND